LPARDKTTGGRAVEFDAVMEVLGSQMIAIGLRTALIVIVAFLLTRLLRRAVRRMEGKVAEQTSPMRALQRTETLTKVLSSAGIVVIWTVAGIYVLSGLGYELAPLLAGVGIIGLAVGFGAQDLVKDVVNGFFILLEDQFGVGDVVQINQEATGKVEQLTLRVTGLRDIDGTMHFVSNGSIDHVANRTKDWSRAVVDVGVSYSADPAKVRRVLEKVASDAKESQEVGGNLYEPPQVLGVEALGEYEVVWRVLAETKPGRQWDIGRRLRERIKDSFDAEGIEIPFPHRVMVTQDGTS
jgi:moderate conductance mechanosensitive channel